MTAQTNRTLSMIEDANIGFGTVRLNNPATSFQAMQLPSMYYGLRSSYLTTRYRPYHDHGFTVTNANTRIYAAAAGPGHPLAQNAVPVNDHNVNGWNNYLHRTDDWLMFVLGVSLEDFQAQIAAIIDRATKQSTEVFLQNNPANNAPHSSVVYIESGELQGTFWGLRYGGWGAGVQFQYYPFVVRDYAIPAANIPNIYNNGRLDQGALYNEFMNGRAAAAHYHRGHALCSKEGLKRFYSVNVVNVQNALQAVLPIPDIATKNLLSRLQTLGNSVQRVNFPALGYNHQVITPANALFSLADVQNNPGGFNLVAPVNGVQAAAAQFNAIANMIANFEE
ncbi:hypothetical protein [Roseibium sp.]|uniref:hypothetical protein n=1 Tax=Roseibium sp. TaxID=1936156 RepID=UPI003BAB280E